ncbi:MAG: site-specific integrase [Victivallaceae bacterium]|nr:site-specific integrase [Victivallaceae bacterium]
MASKTQLKTREKGAGTIYLDGKRWYLKTRIGGKVKTAMLRNADGVPCTTRPEAERAAAGYRKILLADNREEIAVHVAEAKKLKRRSGLRLADAWEAYLDQPNRPDSGQRTLSTYRNIFDLFLKWLLNERPDIQRVAEVDGDTAAEYFGYLWKSGISGRTFNAYLQALRLIFKHLEAPAALDGNPFDGIGKKTNETAVRKDFSAEQVQTIFDGFNNGFFYDTVADGRTVQREYKPLYAAEMRVLLYLCCFTGARGQDGALMRWNAVDFDANTITYTPKKTERKTGGRPVVIPLFPPLRAALRDALEWQTDQVPYILPHVAKRYFYNPTGLQKDVMKIIRCALGVQTTATKDETTARRKLAANVYSLHSFRHTFVSLCANAGVPEEVIAAIVGHGSPAMTRHYTHISTEAKQKAIGALPQIGGTAAVTPADEPERAELATLARSLDIAAVRKLLNIARSEHE